MNNKSIIFMGTPDFAAESLQKLYEQGVDIKAVVTQPDKQRGRGRKVSYTPVKELALKYSIPVIQPKSVKSKEFREELKSFNADLFVVVAFSILPLKVIQIPPLGAINLHASLLPSYRGAAPINYALFNGESKSGVTVFFLNSGKVDSGDILGQLEVEIVEDDNFETLYNKLKVLGANYLFAQINKIFQGNYQTFKQREEGVSNLKAPKLFSQDFIIDWKSTAINIKNKVRGLAPKPAAYTTYKGKRLKILKVSLVPDNVVSQDCGVILSIDKKKRQCYISTGNGFLNLQEVQPEGKGKMDIWNFINGYQLKEGDVFQ